MSPFTRSSLTAEGDRVRIRHLEVVTDILRAHRADAPATFISMHLYWTLYLGVLAHWSNDATPGGEETLAILDESLRLFVSSITSPPVAGYS